MMSCPAPYTVFFLFSVVWFGLFQFGLFQFGSVRFFLERKNNVTIQNIQSFDSNIIEQINTRPIMHAYMESIKFIICSILCINTEGRYMYLTIPKVHHICSLVISYNQTVLLMGSIPRLPLSLHAISL